ncbi:MAG: class F sortase [Propionibacteriaceae bacterium]
MVPAAGVLRQRESQLFGRRVSGVLSGLLLVPVLAGCAGAAGTEPRPTASGSAAVIPHPEAAESHGPVEEARGGRLGPVVRLRFPPNRVTLTDGSHAAVEPAATRGGILAVPTDVRKVGWWDGSAEAGDPFGSTVIAGHVDSATQGLGYFARLRSITRGEVITVSGQPDGQDVAKSLRYRVTSIRSVTKGALSADSAAFDQNGDHRLVLITCTGTYDPSRGGYQDNLVVIATPVAS